MTQSGHENKCRVRKGFIAAALVAALGFGITSVATISVSTAAYAATPQDAVDLMNAQIAGGASPGDALRTALADSVCGGAEAGPTTAALITAALELGIPDGEIGAALGAGAATVEDCNPDAAEEIAEVVGAMGTYAMRTAFVNGVAAAGGSVEVGTIALNDPNGAFNGVFGFRGGSNAAGNPCDNPSCN